MNLRPRVIDFDQSWKALRETVERILCFQNVDRVTWDYNFSDIYFMCVAVPDTLAYQLFDALRECVREHAERILKILQQAPSDDLLDMYNNYWRNYYNAATTLRNLFGYLNKLLSKESEDAEFQHSFMPATDFGRYRNANVGTMVLETWQECLLRPLSERLTPFILNIIKEDRFHEEHMDSSPVHKVLKSYVDVEQTHIVEDVRPARRAVHMQNFIITFYRHMFEKQFVEETARYYKHLTDEAYADLNCSQYMEEIIKKMDEEERRGRRFVHPCTIPRIQRLCLDCLVKQQMERFSSVCGEMVRKGQKKDLKNMHKLLKPWDEGIACLIGEFEQHIRSEGMQIIINNTLEPTQLVSQLESLHATYLNMVKEVFSEDGDFTSALDRALQAVVNYREDPNQPPRISERLNRYVDGLLRKSSKNISDAELDTALNKSITIFRYVDDKDLFQKYYSKMLSSRLIANLSHSMDAEELMITKMKDACGFEFTSKLSRMFTDIGLSRTLHDRFNEYLTTKNIKPHTPVTMMVLQAGAWPLSPISHTNGEASTSGAGKNIFTIPDDLQASLTHFENFYAENHNGRKLNWLYANSNVQVKLGYLDKPYVASMNVYQLCVALMFQTKDKVSMQSIVERLDLPFMVAQKFVKGFVDIGMFFTESTTLDECSVLQLNMKMTSKRLNFKIAVLPIAKQPEKEVDVTCNTLQQDRKYYMECAIVRIMKSRKVMKHSALVEEVIKHTTSRFVPDVPFIKKNIESLIEKLYLQRTDQNDEYQYLA